MWRGCEDECRWLDVHVEDAVAWWQGALKNWPECKLEMCMKSEATAQNWVLFLHYLKISFRQYSSEWQMQFKSCSICPSMWELTGAEWLIRKREAGVISSRTDLGHSEPGGTPSSSQSQPSETFKDNLSQSMWHKREAVQAGGLEGQDWQIKQQG